MPLTSWPLMLHSIRGQATYFAIPSFSHSGSPGLKPCSVSASLSSFLNSLFVTQIHLRHPPSSALRRFTAWSVVPEPAKKSIISAFGLLATKNLIVSWTAYNDLGKVNLLDPKNSLSKFVPPCSALCDFIRHWVPGINLGIYASSSVITEPSCLWPIIVNAPLAIFSLSPFAK